MKTQWGLSVYSFRSFPNRRAYGWILVERFCKRSKPGSPESNILFAPTTSSSSAMSDTHRLLLPRGTILTTSGKLVRDNELGQFWGNSHKGRTDVYMPTDLAWSRLEKFFTGNDDALLEWQENRFVPGAMDEDMTLSDNRAVSVAKELCRVQQRILGLFDTVTATDNNLLPRSDKIAMGLLDLAPQPTAQTSESSKQQSANDKARAVLADVWAIAAARNDLGEFSQNFAALAFCFQLLSSQGLDGLFVISIRL